MTITHQSIIPCPNCGSYYRNDDKCNKCNAIVDEPIVNQSHRAIGVRIGGRLWNKKLHRYLTENEIKAGMKGG